MNQTRSLWLSLFILHPATGGSSSFRLHPILQRRRTPFPRKRMRIRHVQPQVESASPQQRPLTDDSTHRRVARRPFACFDPSRVALLESFAGRGPHAHVVPAGGLLRVDGQRDALSGREHARLGRILVGIVSDLDRAGLPAVAIGRDDFDVAAQCGPAAVDSGDSRNGRRLAGPSGCR